jgi:hypothetical protein
MNTLKRLPIIRHLRWYWHTQKFLRWWYGIGSYFWICPNPADLDFLDDIWKGKR